MTVDALVGRIHSNLAYQSYKAIGKVAALYAEVIARGHVFNDGNKRTALISMLTFLDLNGFALKVDQDAISDQMVDISDGRIRHRQFALWFKPVCLNSSLT